MHDFAARFCQQYEVRPEAYAEAMLRRCLHRRTRPFVWVLRRIDPEYFQPDFELIRSIGKLTHAHTWQEDAAEYQSHPRNKGFLRRRLRLRVSVQRVTRLVNRLLPERKVTDGAGGAAATKDVPGRNTPRLFRE